jgi:hypothetical protein
VLHEWRGEIPEFDWILALAGGMDLDGDKIPDVAILRGARTGSRDWQPAAAMIWIRSGKDGRVFRVVGCAEAPNSWERVYLKTAGRFLFPCVGMTSDRDGDGRGELAIVVHPGMDSAEEWRPARLRVLSLQDSDAFLETTVPGRETPWLFHQHGDIDGDGCGDWLLSTREELVLLYSGASGEILRQHDYRGMYLNGEGTSLDSVGDLNRDGIEDYLIAANDIFFAPDPGFVRIHSGADGEELRSLEFDYDSPSSGPGVDACSLGDIDGDGFCDVLAHMPRLHEARVLSGKDFRAILTLDFSE